MSWIKEISKEIKALDTSSKEIRKFGLVIAIALGVIGSFVYVKSGNFDVVGWLWGIGLLFLILGYMCKIKTRSSSFIKNTSGNNS